MLQQSFTIYDNKSQTYGRPMHFASEEECINVLKNFCNAEDNPLNQIDYDLFHIGEYNENTGKYTQLEAPKHLINLSSITTKKAK